MFRNADGFIPPASCPASPPNGKQIGSAPAELFPEAVSQRFREALDLLDRAAACVSELRNALEHANADCKSVSIQVADLPDHPRVRHAGLPEFGGNFTLEEIERRHVLELLSRNRPLDEVARTLGIDLSTLWRKRKKYGAH